MSSHSKVTPILNGYDRAKREANEDERKREKRGASTNRTYHLTPQGPKSERERGCANRVFGVTVTVTVTVHTE